MPRTCFAPVALTLLASCFSSGAVGEQAVLDLGIKETVYVSDRIVSAGQVDEAQFAALPGVGFQKAICLRLAAEDGTGWEEAEAERLGFEFLRIPVAGVDGLTEANVRALVDALSDGESALVYCSTGNRVGALFALKAYWLDGMSVADAMTVGRAAGLTRAEPQVRELISPD